jgi:hypothetical protein
MMLASVLLHSLSRTIGGPSQLLARCVGFLKVGDVVAVMDRSHGFPIAVHECNVCLEQPRSLRAKHDTTAHDAPAVLQIDYNRTSLRLSRLYLRFLGL